jgi:hypothetical protein
MGGRVCLSGVDLVKKQWLRGSAREATVRSVGASNCGVLDVGGKGGANVSPDQRLMSLVLVPCPLALPPPCIVHRRGRPLRNGEIDGEIQG